MGRPPRIAAALALALLTATPGVAAGDAPAFGESVTVARATRVVAVTPRGAGAAARARCAALAPADVSVREDGRPARVERVEAESPAVWAFLVDVSPSMERHRRAAAAALGRFVARLPDGARALVAPFGARLAPHGPPIAARADITAPLAQPDPTSGTALSDALCELHDELAAGGEGAALVVITDGEDSTSRARNARDVVARGAAPRGVRLFPIVVNGVDDVRLVGPLDEAARLSGGGLERIERIDELPAALAAIAARVARERTVTWIPAVAPGEAPRRVRIEVGLAPGVPCRIDGGRGWRDVPAITLPATPAAGRSRGS